MRAEFELVAVLDDDAAVGIISAEELLHHNESALGGKNSCRGELVGKKIEDCKFVMNGAGAAGIACAEYYISAGAKRENFTLCDSKGTIRADRTDLNEQKRAFARPMKEKTLAEAIVGADVFMGVSVGGALTQDMVRTMAKDAIVFAMANPVPEITPTEAIAAGAAVAGTGRSDFPNQVNNVLGFPGIFRGALDVRAKDINEAMKHAASRALAEIAREPIPADILAELKAAYPDIHTFATSTAVDITETAMRDLNLDWLCVMIDYYDEAKAANKPQTMQFYLNYIPKNHILMYKVHNKLFL